MGLLDFITGDKNNKGSSNTQSDDQDYSDYGTQQGGYDPSASQPIYPIPNAGGAQGGNLAGSYGSGNIQGTVPAGQIPQAQPIYPIQPQPQPQQVNYNDFATQAQPQEINEIQNIQTSDPNSYIQEYKNEDPALNQQVQPQVADYGSLDNIPTYDANLPPIAQDNYYDDQPVVNNDNFAQTSQPEPQVQSMQPAQLPNFDLPKIDFDAIDKLRATAEQFNTAPSAQPVQETQPVSEPEVNNFSQYDNVASGSDVQDNVLMQNQDFDATNVQPVNNNVDTLTQPQNDYSNVGDYADNNIVQENNLNQVEESIQSSNDSIPENAYSLDDSPIEVGISNGENNNQEQNFVAQSSEPVVETANTEVIPVSEEVVEEKQDIQPVLNEQNEEFVATGKKSKKIFRKVALLGLSGKSIDQSIGEKIKTMTRDLLRNNIDVLIDSRSGYGEHVLQASLAAGRKVTGVYLKPYLSNDFAQSSLQLTENESFSVLYSNFLERLRHFAKDARLFVVFENGGLHNLSSLLLLWSLSKMYLGQHKPIILVGESWAENLNVLKNTFGISDHDMSALTIVPSPSDVLGEIDKLNQKFSSKRDLVNVEKVVDRRVEGDEKDFIVY